MARIQPVPKRHWLEATCHLLAGARRDSLVEARAESLLGVLRESSGREAGRFAWVRKGRDIQAAALVLASAGRVGFLYHSPPEAEGVDADALAELLPAVVDQALAGKLLIVQCLAEPSSADAEALARCAGMDRLAQLLYLRCELDELDEPAEQPRGPWSFTPAAELGEERLGRLVRRTYADSLDCPALRGRRPLADILASHRATGRYWPAGWRVARRDDEPAGCLLLNRSPLLPAAEVVYMGVAPEHRRHGLGRAMLARAAGLAERDGLESLQLAVDAGNAPAVKLYEAFGFRETSRKDCFIRFAESPAAPADMGHSRPRQ